MKYKIIRLLMPEKHRALIVELLFDLLNKRMTNNDTETANEILIGIN